MVFVVGSITIYNNKLSEENDLEAVRMLIGVCPQSNVQYDFLTVRENLRLFAKIKGIPSRDVEQEVTNTLELMYSPNEIVNLV